ncbi:hypothetical protein B296_00045618 [Ensete ventricosum]|uniref:Uncharacterized protein n=1 Tax=Ensete ventricosum TaxID=4639 RepID=A0A426Y0L6_ENSVE|nr:hypothetical protein B296_00045618 [Ensete ventricosum]
MLLIRFPNKDTIWKACPQCEAVLCEQFEVAFKPFPQLIALNGLRDAGAIASARAADIYGLNVLEKIMRAMDFLLSLLVSRAGWPQKSRPLRVVDDSSHDTAK